MTSSTRTYMPTQTPESGKSSYLFRIFDSFISKRIGNPGPRLKKLK